MCLACRDLFKTAMYRYMKKCPKPYMHIVRANVDGDWEALVRTRPVGRWQETLALLATYTAQVGARAKRAHVCGRGLRHGLCM